MKDSTGAWIGYGLGDIDPEVKKIATWLQKRFSYAKALVPSEDFDAALQEVVRHARNNLKLSNAGVKDGLWNYELKLAIGYIPPPPPPRHAMLTVRGTGGIVGLDYTSILAQASWNHYEVPMLYAASMGGIPVAAATDPNAPSGNECAEELYQMLTGWVVQHPNSTFSIAAYSLGTKGVTMFLNSLFDEDHPLYAYRNNLVSVIMIADPWRPYGTSFFMGPVQAGQGIGTPVFTMTKAAQAALGWRCCWLVNPADMYTNAPLGGTGAILCDVEEIILNTEVSQPLPTFMKIITGVMKVVKDSGIDFGSIGGGLLSSAAGGANPAGFISLLLPILLGGFQGLISGISGNGDNLPKGPAAAVQAAILALKFYGSGIAGHVHYHDTPWGIGPQTFLDLGIQHANDWGKNVAVRV